MIMATRCRAMHWPDGDHRPPGLISGCIASIALYGTSCLDITFVLPAEINKKDTFWNDWKLIKLGIKKNYKFLKKGLQCKINSYFDWEVILVSVLETGLPGIAVPPVPTITSRSVVRIRINFWRMVGLYNLSPLGDWANALERWRSSTIETGHTRSDSYHRWHGTACRTIQPPSIVLRFIICPNKMLMEFK